MLRSQDRGAAAVATPVLVRKRSNVLEASCRVLLPCHMRLPHATSSGAAQRGDPVAPPETGQQKSGGRT